MAEIWLLYGRTLRAFEQVHRRMRHGYSLLRQSSCLLLLHRLLDALVDEIGPASHAHMLMSSVCA